MEKLNDLALRHKTDKSSLCHDYCEEYDIFLSKYRGCDINLLEFGVYRGNSIRMWLDYFSDGKIYGVDINDKDVGITDSRYVFIRGNQNDESLYSRLDGIEFDIIIDDASHMCEDQIRTFEVMFPRLKVGGLYIVEDTCTSYWNWNGGNITFIEYAKNLIDEINYNGLRCDVEYNEWHARGRKYLNSTLRKNGSGRKFDIKSMYCSNSFVIFFK